MNGLLPEDRIRNPEARVLWKKSERDRALNEYFAGANPEELGIKYKGDSKAFLKSIIEKLEYNYRSPGSDLPGRAERYKPFRRVSRRGKCPTPNEIKFVKSHREQGIDPKVTAKILCREVEEFAPDIAGRSKAEAIKAHVPSLDVVLAYRHAFYNYKIRLVSDKVYDELKEEEIEYGGNSDAFIGENCPFRVKTLALYLVDLQKDLGKENAK